MDAVDVFIPGRLCVLGEHSDWAGESRSYNFIASYGVTVVCATNEGLYARCWCPSGAPNIIEFRCSSGTSSKEEKPLLLQLDDCKLREVAAQGGFYSYVAGTAAAVLDALRLSRKKTMTMSGTSSGNSGNSNIRGADGSLNGTFEGSNEDPASVLLSRVLTGGIVIDNYKTTLPMRKGLSSSAAVCVLVASCFNEVYSMGLDRKEIMEIAYRGERYTPSRCGRMDQCVAMGPGAIGVMEFTDSSCGMRLLACKSALYFVVADLKAAKDTVVILRDLRACFPVPANPQQHMMHFYVRSNQRVAWQAVNAIETGDVTLLGQLMQEAQSEFDRCASLNCPTELTAPRLHVVMTDPQLRSLSLGVKGVGSQGDGTVQVLCANKEQQQKVLERLQSTELGCEAFPLTVPAYDPTTDRHLDRPPLYPNRIETAVVVCSSTIPLEEILCSRGQQLSTKILTAMTTQIIDVATTPSSLFSSSDKQLQVDAHSLTIARILSFLLMLAGCGIQRVVLVQVQTASPAPHVEPQHIQQQQHQQEIDSSVANSAESMDDFTAAYLRAEVTGTLSTLVTPIIVPSSTTSLTLSNVLEQLSTPRSAADVSAGQTAQVVVSGGSSHALGRRILLATLSTSVTDSNGPILLGSQSPAALLYDFIRESVDTATTTASCSSRGDGSHDANGSGSGNSLTGEKRHSTIFLPRFGDLTIVPHAEYGDRSLI